MSSFVYLAITVVFVSAANLSLRHGMAPLGATGLIALIRHILRSPWVIAGGMLYVISLVTWLATLKDLSLGLAYPIYVGGSFAAVLLGSVFLLNEDMTLRRLLGVMAIFGGILLATP